MVVLEDIRSLILEGGSAHKIRNLAMEQGMKSLRDDGCRYLLQGLTTVEEILRITKDQRLNGDGRNTKTKMTKM